jgi:hypothetical protein
MTPRTILRASGAAAAALVLAGLVADIRSFDTTSGGYEPPYRDFTGDPIDWSQTETMRRACVPTLLICGMLQRRIPAHGEWPDWAGRDEACAPVSSRSRTEA